MVYFVACVRRAAFTCRRTISLAVSPVSAWASPISALAQSGDNKP